MIVSNKDSAFRLLEQPKCQTFLLSDHGLVAEYNLRYSWHCCDPVEAVGLLLALRGRPRCRAGARRAGAWSHQSRPSSLRTSRMDIPGISSPKMVGKKGNGPLRGAMPGMKLGAGWGLRMVCGSGGGWLWGGRCMLGLACRPSSPAHFGPFVAVTKFGAGIPVAGHARCCFERVCQSPD